MHRLSVVRVIEDKARKQAANGRISWGGTCKPTIATVKENWNLKVVEGIKKRQEETGADTVTLGWVSKSTHGHKGE